MIHLIYLIRWALIGLTLSLSQFEIAPSLEFLISLIGIFLIAEQLKLATEDLSTHLGEQAGGILLGLMGNLPEIVVSMLALSKGLTNVVKASLSGSIIGNLLFGLGCADPMLFVLALVARVPFKTDNGGQINHYLYITIIYTLSVLLAKLSRVACGETLLGQLSP